MPVSVIPLTAKMRGIAIPVDLDSQVNLLFEKNQKTQNTAMRWKSVGLMKRESIPSISRDYRNIIEGLQVRFCPNHFPIFLQRYGTIILAVC